MPGDADALAGACRTLIRHYPTRDWWPASTRFEVMVGAVLVQNTRWSNAHRAIGALRDRGWLQPRALADATEGRIARVVRPAGCQAVKARRLRHVARGVLGEGGLVRMARRPTHTLRATLESWHGVGEETADAMLLFAFDRPAFIGDAYARRWLARMGLFDAGGGARAYRRCRAFIESRLTWSAAEFQALHAAIVLHGQQSCGHTPRCETCCISAQCSLYKQMVIN